jgi:hypothetical protein
MSTAEAPAWQLAESATLGRDRVECFESEATITWRLTWHRRGRELTVIITLHEGEYRWRADERGTKPSLPFGSYTSCLARARHELRLPAIGQSGRHAP